jgi:uncharacterized protein (TIGR02466 family)
MYVNGLFPVPVASIDERPPTEEELSFIKAMETRPNQGNVTSKNSYILDTDELSDLRSLIEFHIHEYLYSTLGSDNSCSLRITQSWCNYNDSDQYHHEHNHPNSIVSGVYYPQAEHADDSLNFKNPLEMYNPIRHIPTEGTAFNTPSWWLPAQTGTLFLFPSYLVHAVSPIENRPSTRISLSFNTFYRGDVGSKELLAELKLPE